MNMKKLLKKYKPIYKFLKSVLLMKNLILNIKMVPWFFNCRREFINMQASNVGAFKFKKISLYPMLSDRDASAGEASLYLIQDLWAAKKIYNISCDNTHYDIGSRIDGLITHLLSFRGRVTLIDIRPLPYFIDNGLNFIQEDATELKTIEDNSVDSLSALCSLEHFGLGRYGDKIDPQACFKAFDAIQRVVKTNGKVYLSVPIGNERIEFNAHRIFNPNTIIDCFHSMKLLEFSVAKLNSNIQLIVNADLNAYNSEEYCFGLFEFEKE